MRLLNIVVPPFDTTLIGMIQGVASSFGLSPSGATLFGASGHGFVMNIHETLCPSGPYCWDRAPFISLVRNLGISTSDLGFFSGSTSAELRTGLEQRLRAQIDAGRPAGLVNMEYQLITGYDDTGFVTSQPWPRKDFPPARLAFSTWSEFGEEVHVNFFTFAPCQAAQTKAAVVDALNFAVQLYEEPRRYCVSAAYSMGPEAYRSWKRALPEHGSDHGNWWNATVWSECRLHAAYWFTEIANDSREPMARELARDYSTIADCLKLVSDKNRPVPERLLLLDQAESLEVGAVHKIRSLIASLTRAD